MPTHEIATWFLVFSLLLPRPTLLICWLFGVLPYNTTPFIIDVFTSIFVPRVLILVWIYDIQGLSMWFFAHLVVGGVVWLVSGLGAIAKFLSR